MSRMLQLQTSGGHRTGGEEMKICRNCKREREDFQSDRRSKDGLAVECDDCRRAIVEFPEVHAPMYIAQKMRCKICNRKVYLNRVCPDEDLETGEVRALLCIHCNRLLKFARKNRRVWDAVTEYLS